MKQARMKDPVEEALSSENENLGEQGDAEGFSFESVPVEVASKPHPFDGYPEVVVDVKGKKVNLTHWVQFDPSIPIFQDRSGMGQTITDKHGNPIRVVNLRTVHNRYIHSYEAGKKPIDVVFETNFELPNGTIAKRCAFVPDASVRAQLVFKLNLRTSKVEVDTRYKLADRKQSKRLRELFMMIVNPTIKAERLAKEITGESLE